MAQIQKKEENLDCHQCKEKKEHKNKLASLESQ